METKKEILADCVPHHDASRRGYVRVSDIGKILPYEGKFGCGYIELIGRHNNSTYYKSIRYWIKKEAK